VAPDIARVRRDGDPPRRVCLSEDRAAAQRHVLPEQPPLISVLSALPLLALDLKLDLNDPYLTQEPVAAERADSGPSGCLGAGEIIEERVLPARIDLRVRCPEASTLVLKMTYHPNWRVAIDGREVRPFMVSPSFIGFAVPAGSHQVSAEYRSTRLKTVLLVLGGCALLAVVVFRRRLARLEALFPSRS